MSCRTQLLASLLLLSAARPDDVKTLAPCRCGRGDVGLITTPRRLPRSRPRPRPLTTRRARRIRLEPSSLRCCTSDLTGPERPVGVSVVCCRCSSQPPINASPSRWLVPNHHVSVNNGAVLLPSDLSDCDYTRPCTFLNRHASLGAAPPSASLQAASLCRLAGPIAVPIASQQLPEPGAQSH
jgi:hypothetical protein